MTQPASEQRRNFLIIEEGEVDGASGHWAEDDEDGAERLLDTFENVFWAYET